MRDRALLVLLLAACGPGEPCALAPPNAIPCGGGAACDVDADCVALALHGTYCAALACRDPDGCERGSCILSHAQGLPCERDGACASGYCERGVCSHRGPP